MPAAELTPTELRLCSAEQQSRRVHVYVPDTPGVEWLVYAVPVESAYLDDPRQTPRQLALEVAAEARDTAERITYDAVLTRRRDAR